MLHLFIIYYYYLVKTIEAVGIYNYSLIEFTGFTDFFFFFTAEKYCAASSQKDE